MTKDDIIRMAREADEYADANWALQPCGNRWKELRDERFANLVAAAEREECARLCEAQGEYGWQQYADAIRARGTT